MIDLKKEFCNIYSADYLLLNLYVKGHIGVKTRSDFF